MKIFLILFILIPIKASAKNVSTSGALSFLSLSKDVSKYGALSFYHYDIFNFKKNQIEGKNFDAGIIQTYFQTAYNYQWSPILSLAVGHIFQRTNPMIKNYQDEHRLFQQVLILVKYRSLNSTHRFRFEERFIDSDEENEFKTRLRYQIGAKIPLRGVTLDPGEYYINTYNEFYFSTTGQRNAFFSDDWCYFGGGLSTKDFGSFEIGPSIQWSRINEDKDTRTHYTVQFGWILKLN